ncbi:SDR family oxidoreductase [Roseobacter sp. HKCCA0434]|uniref:SDR family oxidoreductase n=1 Tax=Roseobacter sp. HKCCA0434 TaxID=3079297 RepID=UPI0029058BDE|nr:SDR family oxidoreductase [Roseobacter sp. HKCCA0434]
MATILITGASRGIGAEMARQAHARGDTVIATMREPYTADLPEGIERHALDVKSEAGQLQLALEIGNRPIDLVICNAGVFEGRGSLDDESFTTAAWENTLLTNVMGVFFTARTFVPHLRAAKANGTPRLAIISSQLGSSERAQGRHYAYRASKAAATNLARNLAADLKEEGIAVGAWHPGWVQTDMGGEEASISAEDSAAGLLAEFDALDMARTGCFRTWDGKDHPL